MGALPSLLQGLWVTVVLAATSLVMGLLLAVAFAAARWSGPRWLNYPVLAFTFALRSTPLLLQLFLVYYGSGQFRPQFEAIGLWWFFRDPWNCALLTFTLSTAAYTTEILVGGMRAIDRSQLEAAKAYGMSGWIRFRLIVLPQSFVYALPAYTNEIVFQLQATSLASLITIVDLTGAATHAANMTFLHYQFYALIALVYLAMVYSIIFVLGFVERRLTRFRQRAI
jgi:His/Glu/Gln/Arg/opine family amino acid ABC transporter permease subunit